MHPAAQPLDRGQLGLGRVVGHHDRGRDAELARGPRHALGHVAGAGGDQALGPGVGGASMTALVAPRILNELMGCRFSSLR